MSDPTLRVPFDVGVYVHVPWCERVCPYCDFAVVAARKLGPDGEARYVAALLAELERRRREIGERRLASLYLGGGNARQVTPQVLERLGDDVVVVPNQAGIVGGVRAWTLHD